MIGNQSLVRNITVLKLFSPVQNQSWMQINKIHVTFPQLLNRI